MCSAGWAISARWRPSWRSSGKGLSLEVAAFALGRLKARAAAPLLRKALAAAKYDSKRIPLLKALAGLEGSKAIPELLKQLLRPGAITPGRSHPYTPTLNEAHKAAAILLGRLKATRAVPALVRLLSTGALDDDNLIDKTIAAMGAAATPHLAKLLRSTDARRRARAVGALARIKHPSAERLLLKALRDGASRPRWAAVKALRKRHRHAVPFLLATLYVHDCAPLGALARLRDPRAIPALRSYLTSVTLRLRAISCFSMVSQLGRWKDRRIQALLRTATRDPCLRDAAVAGLCHRPTKKAAPTLARVLPSLSGQRAVQVVNVLAEIGGATQRAALRRALYHRAPNVRKAAAVALWRLRARRKPQPPSH